MSEELKNLEEVMFDKLDKASKAVEIYTKKAKFEKLLRKDNTETIKKLNKYIDDFESQKELITSIRES